MSTMRIPIFDATEDAYWWVLCTEKYFKQWLTPETLKMTVAGLAMKGPALTWWLQWYPRHPSMNWDVFTTVFLWNFKPEWRVILPLPNDETEYVHESSLLATHVANVAADSTLIASDLNNSTLDDTQREEENHGGDEFEDQSHNDLLSSEATTWSEAKQSSEAQRGSECLQEFRSSEKFRSSKMFRCLQEVRSYLLVMIHSEDEDVQKLNNEGLSEAIHSRPIRLQVIKGQLITTVIKDVILLSLGASCTLLLYFGQTVKVKLHCKRRRGFTQRIFKDYSCPFYNGNFSNVSMSFSTHINMPKKELMTNDLH
ncbi:hypothetical protein TSUD_140510 [Trifolium subterraneum]|uniref:Swarming motility protein ybiA n=1 Tax=Trifolium subterraneum TaxID=3900 RepID=A0A2Z6NC23_TRISU|nr:hypothetical protein TSUD_140510 [Trifolium subterraneum]